jgi:hypothetical protein
MKLSPKRIWGLIIALLLIVVILLLVFKCCKCCKTPSYPRVSGSPNQMIIWKNPDSLTTSFQTWLGKFKDSVRMFGEITDSALCLSCDSSLLLLSGPGPQIFIQQSGSGGSGGSQVPAPGGGDGPAFYCANLAIGVPDRFLTSDSFVLRQSKAAVSLLQPVTFTNSHKTTIAVFDTGLDTGAIRNQYVSALSQSCLLNTQSLYGWNFAYNNNNTRDDYPVRHGTAVTRFIVNQVVQYARYGGGGVNILPVKIFDSTGKGTLYGFLCGIAYAANSGAKLINASLGFYKYADTAYAYNEVAAVLLENYLQYYLVQNNILMVAAAGNANPTEDTLYQTLSGYRQGNPRDLDSNQFYPAFLDKDTLLKNNLLVVTTVSISTGQVSPLQNYSDTIVDVGVNCDVVKDSTSVSYYSFVNPIQKDSVEYMTVGTGSKAKKSAQHVILTVTGSSFATPIVTGKIAAYYNTLVGNNQVIKDTILSRLQSLAPYPPPNGALLAPNPGFTGKIRNGLIGLKVF